MLDRIRSQPTVQSLLQGPPPARAEDKLPLAKLDRVSLSRPDMAQSLELVNTIVQDRLREAYPSPEPEEVDPELARYPSGASAGQVAGTIFKGVSQVIFGAYSRSHPDMSAADLETFIGDVQQGIEVGFGEARETLEAMDGLTDEVDEAIDETLALLHERLNNWFEGLRAEPLSANMRETHSPR